MYRGILRSGTLTGATLKVFIKVTESGMRDKNDDSENSQSIIQKNLISEDISGTPGGNEFEEPENGENKEMIALYSNH